MEEVDELVNIPFREIVEKGKLAVENAGDKNPVMAKAAQALVKEGERGLKRIEPLTKKHFDDYGSAFIAALKDNDDIAKFRTELTDLLWEFDDYVELDSFEVEKFSELQTASRKAAPKIYDILMRMKLDVSFRDDLSSRGSIPQLPTPTSPPVIPAMFQSSTGASSPNEFRNVDDATAQMRKLLQQVNFDDIPPRPPSTNPWDWQTRPSENGRNGEDGGSVQIRHGDDESPILPNATPGSEQRRQSYTSLQQVPSVTSAPSEHGGSHDGEDRRMSNMSASSQNTFGHNFQRQKSVMSTFSIPENSVSQQNGMIPYFHTGNTSFSPTSPSGRQPSLVSPMETEAGNGDAERFHSTGVQPPSGFGPVPTLEHPTPMSAVALEAQPGLEVCEVQTANIYDSGPIPVEPERQAHADRRLSIQSTTPSMIPPTPQSTHASIVSAEIPPTPSAQCSITDASSFRLAKGFCDGAAEVIRGGIGVKRTKKPVGFASAATVARCLSCLYELNFAEIEADVNKEERGNFTRNGINFRVRFLQKSHIATKRVDDVQYACVFCIQSGSTLDRSDATVFFNQKSLFDHLARHPRPLPSVPGLTIIEAAEVPAHFRNDYDIHFRGPPQRHPCIDRSAELSQMPSGVAKEQARRMYGQRLLYDRSPALELAQGGRVTGLTWPIQYQGEWCFGWHDGAWASAPTELLKLDLPPSNMIRYDRTSLIRGKARWKFYVKESSSKDKSEWLKFDKGDTISNIAWVDSEYWCWSGTNSKGKTGIFPQAFIESDHLQEPKATAPTRAGSLVEEKARSSAGIMSKFGMRKPSVVRPPSAHGSTHSRDTTVTSASTKQKRFAAPGDGASVSGWS